MTLTRLQKVLAAAGVASRRRAEEIILDGRVRVNGRIVKALGTKVDSRKDRIEVDGRVLVAEQPMTLLMNKPRGVVCTASDPEGRDTVVDLVSKAKARLFPVGRLDFATSGALLLTNDGDLAYALTHPKHGVEKTYLLKVRGQVDEVALQKWRDGVDIGDVVTQPAKVFMVEQEKNYTWIEITLHEGRNRQIRRMGEATGLDINKLKRVSFAGLTIKGLRVGQYRELAPKELARLKRDYINPSKRDKIEDPQSQSMQKPSNRRPPRKKRSGPQKASPKGKNPNNPRRSRNRT